MFHSIIIWKKHMLKFMLNTEESIGMLIQPILWLVLFTVGMKGLMSSGPVGDNYVDFVIPGIVSLTALGAAIGGGTVWLLERTQGHVKEYLVAPMSRFSILSGNTMSIVTKSLLQSLVIFIVGIIMGAAVYVHPVRWITAFFIIALYAIGFAGIAIAVASKVDDFMAYHALIFLLNLPLLFMSNALYPLDSLPRWMYYGAMANPTSYVVDGMRQTLLKNGTTIAGNKIIPLWLCFLVVGIFALLGMSLGYLSFKKSLK